MGSIETITNNMFEVVQGFIDAGIDAVEGFWDAGTGSLQ